MGVSYTEEDRGIFGGWQILDDTHRRNYDATVYKDEPHLNFIYQRGAFGDKNSIQYYTL